MRAFVAKNLLLASQQCVSARDAIARVRFLVAQRAEPKSGRGRIAAAAPPGGRALHEVSEKSRRDVVCRGIM
jgi:hypothetical protein